MFNIIWKYCFRNLKKPNIFIVTMESTWAIVFYKLFLAYLLQIAVNAETMQQAAERVTAEAVSASSGTHLAYLNFWNSLM